MGASPRPAASAVALLILVAAGPWSGGAARAASGASPDPAQALRIAGSSYTMPSFVLPWARAFEAETGTPVVYRDSGTSTGPAALLAGSADLASMTRPMNGAELEAFRRHLGWEPTGLPVAADALAVFVNSDNPIERLRVEQVDAIFSADRRCGASAGVARWGQLGLSGTWADRSIGLYGRRSGSGTGASFRQAALCGGRFRKGMRVYPGHESAGLAIAEEPHAIGFGSRTEQGPGMKMLVLGRRGDDGYGSASSAADVYSGRYPLGRQLYLYVRQPPGTALPERVRGFLALALSDRGQETVERAGYLRVPAATLAELRASEPLARPSVPTTH